MTEMPTDLFYERERTYIDLMTGNEQTIIDYPRAEMSCSLKLDFQIDPDNPEAGKNKRKAELANNNLHIWELAEVLKVVGEVVEQTTEQKLSYRVLSPAEIAQLFKDPQTLRPLQNGAAERKEDANIIAAFNGPMAHIYVKGSDSWETLPDIEEVKKIAEILRVTLQGAKGGASPLPIFSEGISERFRYRVGKLSDSIDAILIREGGTYKAYTVVNNKVEFNDIESYFSDSRKYVEPLERLEKMNYLKRSGDIVLLMKDDTDGSAINRYTTGSACKSWHGSLNRSDSYVPFILSYPGGNRNELDKILVKEEICRVNYSKCKGNWKLPDIIKGIISIQYE